LKLNAVKKNSQNLTPLTANRKNNRLSICADFSSFELRDIACQGATTETC